MQRFVAFKIESLHCRTLQEAGLKLRHKGRDFYTGPIVAHVDNQADLPGNLGLIDLETGAITIHWVVFATFPFLADAFGRGDIQEEESGVVRARFEETGHVLPDDLGFDVSGSGQILSGSVLGEAKAGCSNRAQMILEDCSNGLSFRHRLGAGETIRCALVPEHSLLEITLSEALGGRSHRLNLAGGFVMRPVMGLDDRPGVAARREWAEVLEPAFQS
jgi:hypothetical protein